MTPGERADRIAAFGFTPRQARFLVAVMLHSGVCLTRQYCAFGDVVRGQKVHNFFKRLLDRRFASAFRCPRFGTRVYHLHHKPMYAAIGQPNNRHRRALTVAGAVPRLMLLDAVIGAKELEWLGAERDKVARFTNDLSVDRGHLPSLVFTASEGPHTTRFFPDKLPIGVRQDGREHVFLYLAREQVPAGFRIFLRRHAALLQRLPKWTVRLLLPAHLSQHAGVYRAAFLEEYTSPLRPTVANELRWYFADKASARRGAATPDDRYERAARAFSTPRFRSLYRAWRIDGDAVVDSTLSHVLTDALERAAGALEIQTLAHRYDHIAVQDEEAWF